MASIDQIIADAKETADAQITKMNRQIEEAVNLSRSRPFGFFDDELDPDSPTTLALEPPSLTLDQLIDLSDPKTLKIQEDIDREFRAFLNEFYPDFSTLAAKTTEWICDIIESGGEALPGSVEGKIWDRARSREDALNEAATHEATEAMARRGWSAPPGVLTERLRAAQQENIVRQASASRDIAIAQAQLAHEMVKFAVQQSVALQQAALNAAAQFVSEYVRAASIGYDAGANLANAAVNLYNNTIAYYRAFFEQENLKYRFAEGNLEANFKGEAANLQARTDQIQTSAQTAIEAARALGDSAAAALGAQNTMAATVEEITKEE